MRIKHLLAIASVFAGALAAHGVPARPGYHTLTGPDGNPVTVEMRGDENFHYFVDLEGRTLVRSASGQLQYMSPAEFTTRMTEVAATSVTRRKPGEIKRTFPTTGTVRGLVILCEFPETKFQEKSTREYFDAKINQLNYEGPETFGSVADFFAEQSCGVFTPVFDVVGPVTMPHAASYYSANGLNLTDFFRDMCIAADEECDVDFTRYDVDNDGFVDFVFGIFAGYSQAQSLNAGDIWPAMMHLDNYVYDMFDGMYLNIAACASELKGAEGTEHDGVGTICHEFSHILGLPDIYDATYGGGNGMNHWDIMDVGTYNGDGKIPCGYTAMDRYTLGWLDPIELTGAGTDYELPNIVDSNKAVFIVNPENENEYFTLENRQLTGFDSGLPGHGLIISQVNYDKNVWNKNTVNSPGLSGFEHVALIAADNSHLAATESGDPFPGVKGITEFTAATRPAAHWISTDKDCEMPITNIRETEDGRILFDYGTTSGLTDIEAPAMTIDELIAAGAQVFNIAGQRVNPAALTPGIYIVNYQGEARKFTVR